MHTGIKAGETRANVIAKVEMNVEVNPQIELFGLLMEPFFPCSVVIDMAQYVY
ncbi:hypothetical protein OH491_23730 [Termitidicoccus mucosus]|uniref:hypothetical protein n=1 Tax=Termitidicoccus mucosus TaxID=1184151 RepID=UPI002FEDE806